MKDQVFDRALTEVMGDLPPVGEGLETEQFTPWRSAMSRILWGMGLMTFRLEIFYLQYLLPLVGAVLLYLGARSLRKSGAGFGQCWGLSLGLLWWYCAAAVLQATWLWRQVMAVPWVFWGVTAVVNLATLFFLLGLRRGIRQAFRDTEGSPPRDWLALGIAAWVLCLALAVWGQLEPVPTGGALVYYARALVAIALYVLLLMLLGRQGSALAGRGYQLTPSPVKLGAGTVWLLCLGGVLLCLIPALLLGARTPGLEGETVIREAKAETLVDLGMPEELAEMLSAEDLQACASAVFVSRTSDAEPNHDIFSPLQQVGGGTLELGTWVVGLADGSARFFHFFRWLEMPTLSIQEGIMVQADKRAVAEDFSGRLLWRQGESWMAAPLTVELAGGQKKEDLSEELQWWYESELNYLGQLQWAPYATFSIPMGAREAEGYLAYTLPGVLETDPMGNTVSGGIYYYHQSKPLYPYTSLDDVFSAQSTTIISFGGQPPFDRMLIQNGVWPTQTP